MATTKTVKVSTFCDTKVDIDNSRFFIIYSPIEGNINEPWKYAIGNLPDGFKIANIKCAGVPGNLNETFSLNGSLTYVRTFRFSYFEREKEPTITVPETSLLETMLKQVAELQKNFKKDQEFFDSQKTAKPNELSLESESAIEASETLDATSRTSSSSGIASSASSLQAPDTKEDEKQNLLLELQKILLKNEYTDVILKASNGIELKSYRCILAANSPTFKSIFDFNANGLPVEIECEKFSAETILRALSFLYGKSEMLDGDGHFFIPGDELNLLEFANEYSINTLKTKCCKLLESKVSIKNVCELVKTADENNFNELKQKCIKIIAENKNEIDKKDIAKIPHTILLETFYS